MFDLLGSGLLSVFAFLFVMSSVVVFHELGHYWAGRKFGIHAEVFSIGFGKELYGWTDKAGTRWMVSILPLGGFVRFQGDLNAASLPDKEALDALKARDESLDKSYYFKPLWQKSIVASAGPIANFVLAIILFGVLGAVIGERVRTPVIGSVILETPAESAGFQVGDIITALDRRSINHTGQVSQYVSTRAGVPVRMDINRQGKNLSLIVTPQARLLADGFGGERKIGFMGVGFDADAPVYQHRIPLYEAPIYGLIKTWQMVATTGDYIFRLLTGRASIELINGPIGIATISGQVANAAVSAPAQNVETIGIGDRLAGLIVSLIALMAVLSVALGVMNLLPIPMLDGGHLLFYAYEAITGRPVSPMMQELGFRIGLGAILCIFVVATWNDLSYLRGLFS